MTLEIGKTYQMTVDRKTDIGYMLTKDNNEIFLHVNESLHQSLNPGDLVDAFLYLDFKGRVAATLKNSLLSIDNPAFLKVKDIHPKLGVFLDMGISKDLLLSSEDLPFDTSKWPQIGDEVFVKLYIKGKMVAKIVQKKDVRPNDKTYQVKDKVKALVHFMGKDGTTLVTKDEIFIFVHHSMNHQRLHVGESVEVTITFISDKGYSGSLIEQKENQLFDDANMILSYLIREGDLPLDSKSDPEAILEYFNLSKKAFKRAIGHLYKERQIDFKDGMTILVKKS